MTSERPLASLGRTERHGDERETTRAGCCQSHGRLTSLVSRVGRGAAVDGALVDHRGSPRAAGASSAGWHRPAPVAWRPSCTSTRYRGRGHTPPSGHSGGTTSAPPSRARSPRSSRFPPGRPAGRHRPRWRDRRGRGRRCQGCPSGTAKPRGLDSTRRRGPRPCHRDRGRWSVTARLVGNRHPTVSSVGTLEPVAVAVVASGRSRNRTTPATITVRRWAMASCSQRSVWRRPSTKTSRPFER